MIKELINSIISKMISLNDALTKAKIIEYKIQNTKFKQWIHNEINGYHLYLDILTYRYCPTSLIANYQGVLIGDQYCKTIHLTDEKEKTIFDIHKTSIRLNINSI